VVDSSFDGGEAGEGFAFAEPASTRAGALGLEQGDVARMPDLRWISASRSFSPELEPQKISQNDARRQARVNKTSMIQTVIYPPQTMESIIHRGWFGPEPASRISSGRSLKRSRAHEKLA